MSGLILLPCPFCGGDAQQPENYGDGPGHGRFIECKVCKANIFRYRPDPEESDAVLERAWNNRGQKKTVPKRIQRRRTKGWKMPEGAVYVGRPTIWGNPIEVGLVACNCGTAGECSHNTFRRETAAEAVADYALVARSAKRIALIRRELAGRDLVCWCPLVDKDGMSVPCHADVLLEIANA